MEVESNKKALYIVATFTFEMLVSYIHIQLVAELLIQECIHILCLLKTD